MPWEFDKEADNPEYIELYGRAVRSEEELKIAIDSEVLLHPDSGAADRTHYRQLGFRCFCQEGGHPMNGGDMILEFVLSAKGEKFLYKCLALDVYFFIQVKAKFLIKHYCRNLWYVDGDLFRNCSEKIFKAHKNYKDLISE